MFEKNSTEKRKLLTSKNNEQQLAAIENQWQRLHIEILLHDTMPLAKATIQTMMIYRR